MIAHLALKYDISTVKWTPLSLPHFPGESGLWVPFLSQKVSLSLWALQHSSMVRHGPFLTN